MCSANKSEKKALKTPAFSKNKMIWSKNEQIYAPGTCKSGQIQGWPNEKTDKKMPKTATCGQIKC